jgi:hypothetical protein
MSSICISLNLLWTVVEQRLHINRHLGLWITRTSHWSLLLCCKIQKDLMHPSWTGVLKTALSSLPCLVHILHNTWICPMHCFSLKTLNHTTGLLEATTEMYLEISVPSFLSWGQRLWKMDHYKQMEMWACGLMFQRESHIHFMRLQGCLGSLWLMNKYSSFLVLWVSIV